MKNSDSRRQFDLINEEILQFGNETREVVANLRGSDRKGKALEQLAILKEKVQHFETRSLAIYAKEMARIESLRELPNDPMSLKQLRTEENIAELGLTCVRLCCNALLQTFMDEFDLLTS